MVKGLFTCQKKQLRHEAIFRHVQIRLVASNKPLMGSGPLPNWLRDKCCIYVIDTFDDNRLEVPYHIQKTRL